MPSGGQALMGMCELARCDTHCRHWLDGDGDCCFCGLANWCPDEGENAAALVERLTIENAAMRAAINDADRGQCGCLGGCLAEWVSWPNDAQST